MKNNPLPSVTYKMSVFCSTWCTQKIFAFYKGELKNTINPPNPPSPPPPSPRGDKS